MIFKNYLMACLCVSIASVSLAAEPELTENSSRSIDVPIRGVVNPQPLKCSLDNFSDVTISIPTIENTENIPSNVDFDAQFPIRTQANQTSLYPVPVTSLLSASYFVRTPDFKLSCDANAAGLVSFGLGSFKNANQDAGIVQEDLMLDFPSLTGQTLLDYRSVFRLAPFLFVKYPATNPATFSYAYRLGIKSFPTAKQGINILPDASSIFYLGFALTRRTYNFDLSSFINWQQPQYTFATYTAEFPVVVTFN